MKKLLTFLIMLVVGMALFAAPIAGETDATSQIMVETVPQSAGVFAVVTDVSPAVQAGSLCIYINSFEAFAVNDNLFCVTNSLYRQEANPFYGYSKTAALGVNGFIPRRY